MKNIEKISAFLGEVVLPLIGFLLWDWGIYFIFLYTLFDKLSKLLFLKVRLNHHPNLLKKSFTLTTIIVSFFVFEALLMHISIYFNFENFSFLDGFVGFWVYEDLGVQQGPLLIPLLLLSEWMACKRDIKNKYYNAEKSLYFQIRQSVFRIAFLFLLVTTCLFVQVPENFIIFSFLIATLIFIFVDFRKLFSKKQAV